MLCNLVQHTVQSQRCPPLGLGLGLKLGLSSFLFLLHTEHMATFAVGLADTARVKRNPFSSYSLLSFSFLRIIDLLLSFKEAGGVARGASIGLTGLG